MSVDDRVKLMTTATLCGVVLVMAVAAAVMFTRGCANAAAAFSAVTTVLAFLAPSPLHRGGGGSGA